MNTQCQRLLLTGILLFFQTALFAQQKSDTVKARHRDTITTARKVIPLQKVDIKDKVTNPYKASSSSFAIKMPAAIIDIPQAVSTVTHELMQDRMAFTLKDAADNVAGVNTYSGYDEYTIRGFRAENARDINGLRGYNSTYTSPLLVNIEKVEIIKGPTSVLYGNGDPGGTINMITKKPLDTTHATINIYQGSWSHLRFEGDVTGPINQSKTLLTALTQVMTTANRSAASFTRRHLSLHLL